MSDTPGTSLRRSCEHARTLDLEAQLRECVDQLQHPELLAAEIADAFSALREATPARGSSEAGSPAASGQPTVEPFFYASRDIFVVGARDSFTCLAHRVRPPLGPPDLAADEGIDYTAISCTAERRPFLGIVQSQRDASAYPLLLRGLACLAEVSLETALVELDRHAFRGLLGRAPVFDLHLMVWDDWSGEERPAERTPISQLSRDLAECAKQALLDEPRIPPIVRDIVCLQMNPKRFDGRVRFAWRV